MAAASESQWKPKLLNTTEEFHRVNNVKNHRLQDGSTLIEVLKYVERMRPKKFKVAEIGVGYNGVSGEPDSVFISYWIGSKRKRDNSCSDLGYDLKKEGSLSQKILIRERPMLAALEEGKDSFLAAVDSAYLNDCKDVFCGKFFC